MTADYTIRFATKSDVGTILQLIRELAEYEKLGHEVVATEKILNKTMFGRRKYGECLIAEADGKPVGFALFYPRVSTFHGKPYMWVEDIFVKPQYRGGGIGAELFAQLSQIAQKRDYPRIEWWVLDWNKASIEFYHRTLKAVPQTDWTVQRMDRPQIVEMAAKVTRPLKL